MEYYAVTGISILFLTPGEAACGGWETRGGEYWLWGREAGRLPGVKFRLALSQLCALGRYLSFFICKVGALECQPHRQWHEAKRALNSRTLTCGVCWFLWR